MAEYVEQLLADVKAKNPSEPEFHQAVEEVLGSLILVLQKHPEYRFMKILEWLNLSGLSCSGFRGWMTREIFILTAVIV